MVMKDVLKTQGAGTEIKSRAVPQAAIDYYRCGLTLSVVVNDKRCGATAVKRQPNVRSPSSVSCIMHWRCRE